MPDTLVPSENNHGAIMEIETTMSPERQQELP